MINMDTSVLEDVEAAVLEHAVVVVTHDGRSTSTPEMDQNVNIKFGIEVVVNLNGNNGNVSRAAIRVIDYEDSPEEETEIDDQVPDLAINDEVVENVTEEVEIESEPDEAPYESTITDWNEGRVIVTPDLGVGEDRNENEELEGELESNQASDEITITKLMLRNFQDVIGGYGHSLWERLLLFKQPKREEENSSSANLQFVININDSQTPAPPSSHYYRGSIFKASDSNTPPVRASFGPYHHGNKKYALLEEQKKIYVHELFSQNISLPFKDVLQEFNELWEVKAREYYQDSIDLPSDEFMTILLKDGAFIILYMLSVCGSADQNCDPEIVHIQHDMMLLENQVPYFVLKYLWGLMVIKDGIEFEKLEHLIANFFDSFKYTAGFLPTVTEEPAHLVDLLRIFMAPENIIKETISTRKSVVPMSALQLSNGGVVITMSEDPHLTNVKVTCSGIRLKVPRLLLDSTSETLFRNIILFEQYHSKFKTAHACIRYISDYMFLMDSLLKGSDSDKLLVNKGILVNKLRDGEAAIKLVNDICKDFNLHDHRFYYYKSICHDMGKHCDRFITRGILLILNYKQLLIYPIIAGTLYASGRAVSITL